MIMYLSVSNKALSLVLVQEGSDKEKPVCFVNKVLKGAELKYWKIERLALVVIVTAKKWIAYFQVNAIWVKKNYTVK